MLEVYQTSAPGATPCLFETRTLKEQLEDLKSPLASLTDAFNFEKYRPQIIACIQRETTKQKIANQAPHESKLPKHLLSQIFPKQKNGHHPQGGAHFLFDSFG